MSGKQQIRVCVSAASRELTRNFLTALPKESEGVPIPSVLPENPEVGRANACWHYNYCHLIKIKGGRKYNCNPNQCQPFKFYQKWGQSGAAKLSILKLKDRA